MFAPARSCIRKRRKDDRLTGARTSRDAASFTLGALAGQLAGAAHGFRLLARALFRRLLVVNVTLHFAEVAFALHLLLQRLEGLIDVVVADENLNQRSLSYHPFPLGPPDIRRRRTDKSLAPAGEEPSGLSAAD